MLAFLALLFQACGSVPAHSSQSDPAQELPVQLPVSLFDGQKAFTLLKEQTTMGPRYPGSGAHEKTLDWIVKKSEAQGAKVAKQEFTHRWSKTGKDVRMTNVIADMQFGGAKTVLLLAHWDTRPTADQDLDPASRTQPIIGASDGASGVAVLLELMRVFKERPPAVNVRFLFTDGEDLGPGLDEMFLGAKHFAKNLGTDRPSFGILLDMVGDADLRIPKEPNSARYAGKVLQAFYANAAAVGLGKYFPNEYQTEILDDHLPLNEAGIPTIDLIDFDYPYWHTMQDTADKCSAASLSVVGKAVETFLRKDSLP